MRKIFLKIEKRRSIKTITKYLGENILLRFCGVFSKIIFFIVSFLLFNPSNINAQQNINGLSFDGNNDFISLGNSSLLKPTSALTIESWLYLNSWNQAGTQTIISTYDTAGYSLVVQNGQLIGSLYRNGTTATVTYNVSSYTGWHHVALYFNGQYLRLYTDGSLRSTNNAGATYSIGYNPLLNVFIGASPVDTSNFLNGVIDEIRIWSTARTISTSSVHYEVLPTTTGLIAYYRLNQGIAGYDNTSITEIVDLTSNSLNGFLNNFLLTGSTSNFVEGKALKPINTSSSLTPIDNQLTQFTISWIRPGENKGGNGVKVFVREGVTSGSAAPVDGTDYNANSIFKSGDQIGTTGWYCVYDGNDTFTTVYGLNPSTTYRIHVIEYQELSGQPIRYSTATATNNPRNTYTLFTPPSMQASGITFSNINGTSFTINWTRGNGSNCIVFLKQADDGSPIPVDRTTYTANSRFKSGTQIGTTGWYCVYKGTGTSVNVTYLTAGQTYRAKVIEFNGVTGFESYYILDTISNPLNQIPDYFTPSVPASNVSFSNMNGTSITVSWTKGDGSYTIVFAKKTALADSAQPTNNTTYTASATFGSGTQIGSTGWYCVYKGTGTYVNVAGLTAGQTYAFMAITFNGTSGYEKYLTGTSANNPNYQLMDYVVPVTQASNIVISNLAQRTMTVSFTRGSGSYRIVFIKQGTDGTVTLNNNTTYTANASFGSGSTDGYGWYCVYKGTGTSVNVSNLTPLTDYRVMVCEYNGIAGFEKYNTTTSTNNPINTTTIDYSAPTIQASNLNFTNIYSNRYTVSWTRGNGSSCIVFAKKTSDTLELPSPDDNVTYTANATFGSGTQIGTSGWYCIYKGTGTLVTMTGLTADSTYRIMVCEFNGIVGYEKYLTSTGTNNPRNRIVGNDPPTIQASNITYSSLNGTSFTISWTRGNGTKCAVFLAQTTSGTAQPVDYTTYTANTRFRSGSQIGTSGWYCVYNNTGSSVTITGLTAGQTYRAMVCEYNGNVGVEAYNTSTADNNPLNQMADYSIPTIQAQNITFTNINSNSFTANWTKGNGAYSIVFVKETDSGSALPVNNTTYTANATYKSGSQIGTTGWYCVYKGTGTYVTITGLTVEKTYRVMVCSYNGTVGYEKYNTTDTTYNPNNQKTSYPAPTTQASGITFTSVSASGFTASWTNGNGSARAVFVKATESGTATPEDYTTYTANPVFGDGSQIGSTGWYCVYNGTGSSVDVSGLSPATYYRVMVCEYNGSAGYERYNSTEATNNPNNVMTDFLAPTTQASFIIVTDIETNSVSVYWYRGNGVATAIFVAQTTTGQAYPEDNTTYMPNSAFGEGDQIGSSGWYCVYNGSDDNFVQITNLQPGTEYRLTACEYNGTPGKEKYNTSTNANNPYDFVTAFEPPTIQATNVTFTSTTTHSSVVSWTRGNGQKCAAFIYLGTSGSATPIIDSTYSADSFYSIGEQIGVSGWYCIYNGSGNSTYINGLTPNKTYRVSVIEYNGTYGHEKYLTETSTNNPSNVTTLFAGPTTQARSLTFSSVTSNSFTVNWTRGNGTGCAVFVSVGSSGVALPSDSTPYTADAVFKNGSQLGTTGWYCVYKGAGNSTVVSGLDPNTYYNVMVCEYFGTSGNERYNANTATNNPRSQITGFSAPTTQASNISFSSITNNSMAISWTNGNGAYRAVFLYQGSIGTAVPVDNTTYTANSVFKSGTQIGTSGWYCIYNGTGNNVTVTGLSSSTTYRAMVCEYNGTSGSQKYNKDEAINNPANQATNAPGTSVQAKNIVFSDVTNNSFTISWTRGDGDGCVVFVKNTGSGTPVPINNNTYTGNSSFGAGSQIGTSGWYCVYNGSGTSVSVSNLSSALTYKVMVCEYAGTAGNEQYNTNTSTNNPSIQITTPYTIWDGTAWSNGSPDATKAAIINGAFSASSNIVAKSLYVANNISVDIQPGNYVTVYTDFTNFGTFTLKSPSNMGPAGSLITYKEVSNNKTMRAERYITPGTLASDNYTWHYMGTPVGDFKVETAFTGDYVYELLENSNSWSSLKTGDFISVAKGYMVKTIVSGGKTIIFNGTFNSGTYTIYLTNTGGTEENGYNLISNPYPSAVDWNASSGWTKTNISTTIWIWNPVALNYATWNGIVSTNGGSRYIPAAQGFIVKVNQGYTSGLLSMNDNVRIHSSQNSMKKSASSISGIIKLRVSSSSFYDEVVLYKDTEEASAQKLFSPNPEVPQIYLLNDKKKMSILAIPDLGSNSEAYQIGLRVGNNNSYTFTIEDINVPVGCSAYMVDKFNNDTILLNKLTQYNFNGSNYYENRFVLLIMNKKLNESTNISKEFEKNDKQIEIWSNLNKVYVNLPDNEIYTIEIFNVLGNIIYKKIINFKGLYDDITIKENGIYFVKVSGKDISQNKKVYIKK